MAVPETHDDPGAAEEIARALGGAAGRLVWARPLPVVAAILVLAIWVVSGRVWGLPLGLAVAVAAYMVTLRRFPRLFVWQARRARRLTFSRSWPARAEALGLVGGRVGGERPIPRVVEYVEGEDGSSRVVTLVLPAGLTPADFAGRAEHLAHDLGVFRVAVGSPARGRVSLTLFPDDLLGSTARPDTAPAIPPIRLGMAETQGEWSWDPARCPHVLVCGQTGSGKSSFLRSMLRGWPGDVMLSDPKLLEFGAWVPGGRLLSAVHRLGDIDAMLAGVTVTVRERAAMLAGQGATHWTEAPAGLRALLVILDEWPATMTLTEEGESAKDAKARQDRLAASLDAVANLGRAVGVHLVLGAQRPDANLFRSGATREQFTGKVALGWLTPEGAGMMFGDRAAAEMMSGEAGTGAAAGFSAPVPERVRVDYVTAAEAHAGYGPGEPPLSGVGA